MTQSDRESRVLQVVLSLKPGGAERTVVELVKRSEGRVRNLVCCLDASGDWAGELTRLGVPVVVLGRAPGFRPIIGVRLARLAAGHGARIVHCHQYSPFVYARVAQLCWPFFSIIFTEQGRASDAPPSPKRRAVNRILGTLPCRAFAVSSELRNYMIAEGFPARRLGVIRNGVDPGGRPDPETRRAARRRLQLPEESFVVGTAARFDPVKDLRNLIEAFAEVERALPDARLVLLGDGPERQSLLGLVESKRLTTRVLFTGMRSDVRSLLPALNVYVNCSVSEGTSLTIMEAMAAQLPVIATRVGGNPEVVVEAITGLLVPARSPSELASAVVSLAVQPDVGIQMGRAGRERMETHFAMDGVVDQYVNIYKGDRGGR